MSEWHFFDIGFSTLNLFSFMLGATWAFFNQGLFGKRIGIWVIGYFAALALFYGVGFYAQSESNKKFEDLKRREQVVPDPNPEQSTDDYFKRQG